MTTPVAIEDILKALPTASADTAKLPKLLAELNRLDNDRAANLAKIKGIVKQLNAVDSKDHHPQIVRLREWVMAYESEISQLEQELRQRFGKELAISLRDLDLTLTGQYPLLHANFFTFHMLADQSKVEIWYGYEQELLDTAPLLASEVSKRVTRILKQLGRSLRPIEYLVKLEEAIRRVPHRSDLPGVPIIKVLPEIAHLLQSRSYYQNPIREHYRSYSRADFSYDLDRCRRDVETRGRVQLTIATRMYTRSRDDFLWIPDVNGTGGTTYSHLSLKETVI
ncbi:hypothetical protein [Candidatus Chloroploca asiatica]|uniref:Uncharacterized protein n=1 Tax=Candidatus Chloroploca asiatica TaxID=1506545 RepID=A0A2H3KQI4_9CHLR|nr:hypothetical protein [Candidatus Chloroploca asiatica]PDW00580.1 hypothetical protein A9Q02_09325 [Candidatus Chloroploca asiatica]